MPCTICNQFQGQWPINSRLDSQPHDTQPVRNYLVPKFTWEELELSASACYCCEILAKGCRECFSMHGIQVSDIRHCSLRFYYPLHVEDVEEEECGKYVTVHLASGKRFEVEVFATEDDECPVPDAWDYFATSKRTSPGTDSEEALGKMKEWIEECVAEHSDYLCQAPEHPILPKRVVDVGRSNEDVKLVETNGEKGQYICLSHCWGPTQIITTKLATLEDRKKGIPWSELSKTFQEAITLTRTLGFQYIWIDSLCIIQDSAQDWEIESAKMASIYSEGHLTIAATRSPDGAGGLFCATPDVEVFGTTPDGEAYSLFFRQRIDHQLDAGFETAGFTATEAEYPLLTRAWVYQERMLSTRVLHFGRYELFFECKSAIRCECGAIAFNGAGTEAPVPLIKIEYADILAQYHEGYEGQALEDIRYQGARMWRTMVCGYTALRLTMSKDRLPAIRGLAKQLASGRRSRYLAGLWEESLQDDLLWMVYATSTLLKPRPYPPNAPTWSWASVETLVSYWDCISLTDIEGNVAEEREPYEQFSVIELCEVQPSGMDDFGTIKSGELRISGHVAEGILEREVDVYEGKEIVVHYVTFANSRLRMKADYLLDHEGPHQTLPGTTVLCLRLSLLQEGEKQALISLVLKKSPHLADRYERIGTLKVSGRLGSVEPTGAIFEGCETRKLVIV
ncbi:HET-domain-containing protein [Westerdykella ornata]|uniref:HET-domain-containing protein n=1 Tax=Westerdykella ornata TaxID=318751 RepID=A0A6A6JCT1_WESOR|nr:HET-domain-containing protein [Westerdykella ornata]KAF2273808.1 HET-domain-containing protein [Westerdykella ornata]